MLYYGVESAQKKGHFLFDNSFNRVRSNKPILCQLEKFFIELGIDQTFCPQGDRSAGSARLIHTQQFTILSFWDYSGDPRPGSNSSFIEFGEINFGQMVQIAIETFPHLFVRFDFPIVQVEDTQYLMETAK